jgi:hypothetical protein
MPSDRLFFNRRFSFASPSFRFLPHMTEETIRSLLRQRAGGEMPPGYRESLLQRLHQRQRAEMLQRSVLRIAVDRIGTFWGEHSTSTGTYAFSLAALVAVGAGVIFFFKPYFSGDYSQPAGAGLAVTGMRSKLPKSVPGVRPAAGESAPARVSPVETQQVSFGNQKD